MDLAGRYFFFALLPFSVFFLPSVLLLHHSPFSTQWRDEKNRKKTNDDGGIPSFSLSLFVPFFWQGIKRGKGVKKGPAGMLYDRSKVQYQRGTFTLLFLSFAFKGAYLVGICEGPNPSCRKVHPPPLPLLPRAVWRATGFCQATELVDFSLLFLPCKMFIALLLTHVTANNSRAIGSRDKVSLT